MRRSNSTNFYSDSGFTDAKSVTFELSPEDYENIELGKDMLKNNPELFGLKFYLKGEVSVEGEFRIDGEFLYINPYGEYIHLYEKYTNEKLTIEI